ncbi:MAG: hypothetical protein COT00_00130 [Candidatus Omnitrophica bacterium CG07_land_8_20_14_0_80_50_8]|nr:MAG: hypothetical protein COT00_00130 [Candidatus Omnitrophica bacterium CG07_land_8_20_14_0_80_50_8]
MIKKISSRVFFLIFIVVLSDTVLASAERIESKDEDKDGRKETRVFYEGSQITRVEVDKNGDGKPDQWVYFKSGIRNHSEIDADFDGKIDKWVIYDAKGVRRQTAKDTNHDGKPDEFLTFLKGRDLVLKEYDRNFDGRIDKRMLQRWDPNRKITTFINGRPGSIPNPSYLTLRREEDNNFDGKIDVYRERENKNPPADKIGKEIDSVPAKIQEKKNSAESDKKKNQTDGGKQRGSVENLVQNMNERHQW